MSIDAIIEQRLAHQRLAGDGLPTPAEVVAWLGAVQAQDFAGAKWALGLRTQGATDASIEKAFDRGMMLRTHAMRPTWHFVAPEDIRWMQKLTAPRVNQASAGMYRQVGLDEALFAQTNNIIAKALQGGHALRREDLGVALAAGGIEATGNRLAYIVMRAELDALICSGPRRGKQFTYMLVEERAPEGQALAGDEALAELARRYYTGHGPGTLRDFAWWSGLTVADAKKGVEILGSELCSEEADGEVYWRSESVLPASPAIGKVLLLPTYDEFVIGFTGKSRPGGEDVRELLFDSTIVVEGKIAGTWRRTLGKGTVVVEVKTLAPLAPDDDRIVAAAERYAAFVQMPLEFRPVSNISDTKVMGWRRSRLASQDKAGMAAANGPETE
jgi:hypothetical protein